MDHSRKTVECAIQLRFLMTKKTFRLFAKLNNLFDTDKEAHDKLFLSQKIRFKCVVTSL